MRAVIQRVKNAYVDVPDADPKGRVGEIGAGVLVLLAVTNEDSEEDVEWMVSKISQMRIFEDEFGKMNLSVSDIGADALVISQFTLYGNMRKGNRPSFNRSARPETAEPLYLRFCERLGGAISGKLARGHFGAMMNVGLVNDGPVTIILDSKDRGF